MTEQPHKPLHSKILAAIERDKVSPRSKAFFTLRTAGLVAALGVTVLAAIFLVSFTIFSLQQSGGWFMPLFGLRGIGPFLAAIPWSLIVMLGLCLGLTHILLRHYRFSYRRPVLYSLAGLGVVLIIVSMVISTIRVHEMLAVRARQDKLPVMGELYLRDTARHPAMITAGKVVYENSDGFDMLTRLMERIRVTITPRTHLPFGRDFAIGDMVVVLGKRHGDEIKADGVCKTGQPAESPQAPE